MKEKKIPLTDMHSHICSAEKKLALQEIRYRQENDIITFFSTGNPEEWEYLREMISTEYLTFGIHPWNAAEWNPSEWMNLYRECRWIGEIGMDTLWCDVPIERQQQVFEKQLEIAADLGKAVVLHTKDCEEKIAEIIRDFPCPVLVHWYSGDEKSLKKYVDQNCWFTLGADTGFREPLLLSHVPQDRLITETDGIGAIRWAFEENGKEMPLLRSGSELSLIPETLQASLNAFAEYYGSDPQEAKETIYQNLLSFIS